MSKNIIDTNLIIRFLLNDDAQKASKVEKILFSKDQLNVLPDLVVGEIIWVLSSFYKLPKLRIIENIRSLLNAKSISSNKVLLNKTLLVWEKHNIDFIDSYIAAVAQLKNPTVYSYDNDFSKIKSIKRKEP